MTLEESLKLEKFTRMFNYLLENATLDHDMRNLMVLNGYNYDDITDDAIRDFIERWEKERPGEYTCFKIEQGISYCYNNLLKILLDFDLEIPSLENDNDKILYSYYQTEVCNDLMDKFFRKEKKDDLYNEQFIINFMKECRDYFNLDNRFLSDKKFVQFISSIYEKNEKRFGKKENIGDNIQDKISVIRSFIEQNDVSFPGKDYYRIYDSSKKDETVVDRSNYSNKDVISSVKILRDNGVELTKEQAEKLGLPIMKSREKIDSNVEAARNELSFLSSVREEWQNSPSHVDNLRSDEIKYAQLTVDRLIELDKEKGLTPVQIDLLNGYIDFLKYSRDVNERNIGPMSDEVRSEMQKFYFEKEEDSKRHSR